MSEPVIVTYSLEEVLKELKQEIKDVNTKLNTIQKDVTDLKIGQVRLEEKLTGDIKALDTEVKGINKRLDSQEFLNRSVVVGFILAFVSGVIKLFFPNFLHFPN
ncbi:hypothetical protein VB715_15930 [Crocosphaera sp. UHCC 0190]|uniref:hypothetical protein n=1 Tax=Crocosphaera sp. UHCC 0190 TaxID=3110246 RepID=UPI002B20C795|nr:hypothetical protein [Crocosphaera sp. UHCC 0190]MEA5511262.1 hypothetical protein [Crocosphaera sp. UHCC 0190]